MLRPSPALAAIAFAVVLSVAESRAATPPSTPTGLVASAVACNTASLSWSASRAGSLPLYAYKIFRDGVFFRWVLDPSTSTFDGNIGGANTYTYAVLAVDEAGNPSPPSAPVTVTTPPCPDSEPPTVPSGLTATVIDCDSIALGWQASTDGLYGFGMRGYRVYRNGLFLQSVTAPATSVTDESALGGSRYTYAVSAVDRAGNESPASGGVVATTPPCGPPTVNQPPIAQAGADVVTQTLTALRFDASASSDPDDGIQWYVWDFGDGTGASGPVVTHAYQRTGTYFVRLTVTDHFGLAASDTVRVGVFNRAPLALAGGDRTARPGEVVVLSDAGSFDQDGSIASYTWSFGDGATASGATVSHAYAAAGTYTVTLTVTDDVGARASDTLRVTVTPVTPPPQADSMWVVRVGGSGTDMGQAVAGTPDGGAVVGGRVGGAIAQAFLAKYSATGTQIWTRTSSGPGQAEVYDVASDAAGNIVATGWFQDTIDLGGGPLTSAGGIDLFVARYAGTDGRLLWSHRYGGVASDIGYGITVDGDGVIVTGFFQSSASLGGETFAAVFGGVDTFVARFASADGSHVWSRNLGGASDDIGYSVSDDGRGNVVLTGFFRGRMSFGTAMLVSAGANDIFVAKLQGGTGQTVWARSFGGPLSERGYRVAVDARGDVALAGFFQGLLDLGTPLLSVGSTDILVAKLSGVDGEPIWGRGMGGAGEDYALGVGIDENQDVLLAGRFKETVDFGAGSVLTAAGDSDAFVARYSSGAGQHLASRRFGGDQTDLATAIAGVGTRSIATGSFEGTVDFGRFRLDAGQYADLFLLSLE